MYDSFFYVYYNFIYLFFIGRVFWGVLVFWLGLGGMYFNKVIKMSNVDGGIEFNWFLNINFY